MPEMGVGALFLCQKCLLDGASVRLVDDFERNRLRFVHSVDLFLSEFDVTRHEADESGLVRHLDSLLAHLDEIEHRIGHHMADIVLASGLAIGKPGTGVAR